MVINDLEEALKCIGTEVKDGRFNSWAVKGLLARVNLYKRDWDKAFSYAEDVIKNSPYSLLKQKTMLQHGLEDTLRNPYSIWKFRIWMPVIVKCLDM